MEGANINFVPQMVPFQQLLRNPEAVLGIVYLIKSGDLYCLGNLDLLQPADDDSTGMKYSFPSGHAVVFNETDPSAGLFEPTGAFDWDDMEKNWHVIALKDIVFQSGEFKGQLMGNTRANQIFRYAHTPTRKRTVLVNYLNTGVLRDVLVNRPAGSRTISLGGKKRKKSARMRKKKTRRILSSHNSMRDLK